MASVSGRKPVLKKRPSGKFKMHDFQIEDISELAELDASANWSEMGAMKTTTAEWLWQFKTQNIPNPRVLVITTKAGKGTYYESLPEVLPDWDVFTVGTTRFMPVVGSRPVPVNVELPDPLYMRPVCVIAHYHCFTNRACLPQQIFEVEELPNGQTRKRAVLNEDGTFAMRIPRLTKLLTMHWDMVVIDEAHRLKNHDAQWTRNIKKIKTQYKHIMTGTGFINNPAEVWSLLNFLYPQSYRSYWKFREYFCEEDDFSGYRKIVGTKRDKVDEFRDLVRRVGVRRTMNEVFPDIQEPIESEVLVDLNPTQKKMYTEIKNELSTLDAQGVPLHSPNVLSMLNRLRQICVATPKIIGEYFDPVREVKMIKVELVEPSSKLDAVMEILDGLEWTTEKQDQVVVFSNFKDPLKLLAARLDKTHIKYLHLKAEMNEKDRYELWHDVWPRKQHQVFLTTLALGSESINLASATRAIFLDQAWSPKDNAQAVGRIYRPGQTGVAQLIYIRAEGTVDFRVLDANQEKRGWFKEIFGVVDVSDEDLEEDDD